jgi:hypothetical protein
MVTIRDASAKSLYRAITLRSSVNRRWGQINAYYTMSSNLDDDYQERSAGGVQYQDRYNWAPDYSFSDINRRHQFVAQPVFFMPWGFELSSALRFVSGAPLNPTAGSDLNKDGTNNDRPYQAVGVSMKRNSFTNLATTYIDLGVRKSIRITESKQLSLGVDMFNLFNLMNLTYSGSTATNYCSSTSVAVCGIPSFMGTAAGQWKPSTNFMSARDLATGLVRTNTTNTNSGYSPFEAQFSFKFIF